MASACSDGFDMRTETEIVDSYPPARIHGSAHVSDHAVVGEGSHVWHEAQVREGAVIGRECTLGKGSYVDAGVQIGDRCKLQNSAFVFRGFELEDGVFLGPGVMLLNDKEPRAVNPDGSLKTDGDWHVAHGVVCEGASIGGGAVILPGVRVGRYALVGAGSVVTKDVPNHGLVYGNPARLQGFACICGHPLGMPSDGTTSLACSACGRTVPIQIQT